MNRNRNGNGLLPDREIDDEREIDDDRDLVVGAFRETPFDLEPCDDAERNNDNFNGIIRDRSVDRHTAEEENAHGDSDARQYEDEIGCPIYIIAIANECASLATIMREMGGIS